MDKLDEIWNAYIGHGDSPALDSLYRPYKEKFKAELNQWAKEKALECKPTMPDYKPKGVLYKDCKIGFEWASNMFENNIQKEFKEGKDESKS